MPRAMTDEELIRGCLKNDRRYQEMLYRKYFATMLRMCMRYTSDREKALEIVNNGFLRVFQKLDTFAFKGSFEGWIRKLVYHSMSDYFKKDNKRLRFLDLEDRDDAVTQQALDNLYVEDIIKLVDKLPPATQKVFKMYAIEGYTHPEISKKINISVGTSKWHLNAARKKLKDLIKENYTTNRYYAG